MVEAADEAYAPVLEARHEHEVPQGPPKVEGIGQQGVGERTEALQAHRLAGAGVALDVRGETKVRIVDPERIAQPRRRLHHALAEPGHQRQARRDRRAQRFGGGWRTPSVGGEEGNQGDVHVHARLLQPDERCIEGRQLRQRHPVHDCLNSRARTATNCRTGE